MTAQICSNLFRVRLFIGSGSECLLTLLTALTAWSDAGVPVFQSTHFLTPPRGPKISFVLSGTFCHQSSTPGGVVTTYLYWSFQTVLNPGELVATTVLNLGELVATTCLY